MGFKIDHSRAGSDFEPIKPGEYEVVPINYELKPATDSGNNRIVFDYEIRSDVDQPCQGQKLLYDNFTITENAMWRIQQASKAAGFPDGMEFANFKEWADTFKGKAVRVYVGERTHNGKKYPEVKRFMESIAAPVIEGKPLSDSDVPF
ncbi:DUF669 domain-containing protein [Brevibacillus sp. DP1.3A]|uniref:DUF669 domain-containing protein n=1 Tax=Brevibacillus sp. DP1.3A TaxID=2738867 RepID=UPI00156BD192|nr:DUF669 domain-containing protein [Brevibacillus sp. DP1.3A]UED76079.1 DUF669 domain-containing protein [Brevibacillus sp. DP1.3A]